MASFIRLLHNNSSNPSAIQTATTN